MIYVITPTGDRPLMLELARKYVERAIKELGKPCTWVVVDDGVVPFDPGGCTYARRTPDGTMSLGRNLLVGLDIAKDADLVYIWEDDDWYAKTRLTHQFELLQNYNLVGYKNSIYYNLQVGGYKRHGNIYHSSLFETAMHGQVARNFVTLIEKNINEPYLDLLLWRKIGGRLTRHCGQAIGIKGGFGRGHAGNGLKMLYNAKPLQEFIGNDAQNYVKGRNF